MTTADAFPCGDCQTLIGESAHPDGWLCLMCVRKNACDCPCHTRPPPPPIPPGSEVLALCCPCYAGNREPEPVAPEDRSFAIKPNIVEREEIPVESVIQALQGMASDKRMTNEPVRAIFQRAVDLLTMGVHTASESPYKFNLEEAQRKYVQSMLEAGVDPDSMTGMIVRGSFIAAWKVARARKV